MLHVMLCQRSAVARDGFALLIRKLDDARKVIGLADAVAVLPALVVPVARRGLRKEALAERVGSGIDLELWNPVDRL
jgi:hypothetical protein